MAEVQPKSKVWDKGLSPLMADTVVPSQRDLSTKVGGAVVAVLAHSPPLSQGCGTATPTGGPRSLQGNHADCKQAGEHKTHDRFNTWVLASCPG